MVFISNKLSLLLYSYIYNVRLFLIRKPNINRENKSLVNSVEVAGKLLTLNEADKLYNSVKERAKKISRMERIEFAFIFNGTNVAELAIQEFAKKESISLLFFELSNIPGKIFVDIYGVNARSSLYFNIEELTKYHVESKEFETWKKEYITYKEKETIVPQGKRKTKINNILLPLDIIGYKLFKIPYDKKEKYVKKFFTKIFNTDIPISYDKYNMDKKDYIFLPLQVSTDSQILLNSEVDNCEAIKIGLKLAKEKKLNLVVKPHPAETDNSIWDKLKELKRENILYIVNENTFKLIKNAQMVITINSTVGLEAMILGKKVLFLGRTFFPKLTPTLLKNYILSYLVNIDFFSNEPVNVEKVKKMLSMLK